MYECKNECKKPPPFVANLIESCGGYMPNAIADAINACRMDGSAQLLVSYDRMYGSWLDEVAARAVSEIKAMAVDGEVFEIAVISISEEARRIDVTRKSTKSTKSA